MSQLSDQIERLIELNGEEIEPEDGSVMDAERYWDCRQDKADEMANLGFAIAMRVRSLAALTDEIEEALHGCSWDAEHDTLVNVGHALGLNW